MEPHAFVAIVTESGILDRCDVCGLSYYPYHVAADSFAEVIVNDERISQEEARIRPHDFEPYPEFINPDLCVRCDLPSSASVHSRSIKHIFIPHPKSEGITCWICGGSVSEHPLRCEPYQYAPPY